MTKTKIAAISTAAVALFVGWQYFIILSSEVALFERFPDIDKNDVIKASRKMYFDALRGKFADIDTNDDALMDHVFLNYVKTIQGR